MSRSKLRPRPEQVAALTQGMALPLAPLPQSILRVVAETMVRAWNEVAAKNPDTLRNGDEDEVTSLLQIRLNALRNEEPCWEDIARGVSRDSTAISFDGSHLKKQPDLSIHLTRRGFDFPVVAECKLIDRPRRKTVELYCSHGLARFVRGEYAWMAQEAFMLAYVRDGGTIADTLRPCLAKRQAPDPCATETLPAPLPRILADLARSRHGRRFAYLPPTSNPDPGTIELWHLWLVVTPRSAPGR